MDYIREHTSIVLGIVVAVFAVAGYLLFFRGDTSTAPLSVTRPQETQGGVSQELLSTLLQLHSMSLDERVWSDPVFKSLRDFGVALSPAPVGRPNPFAPLGSALRNSSSQSSPTPKTPASTGSGSAGSSGSTATPAQSGVAPTQ